MNATAQRFLLLGLLPAFACRDDDMPASSGTDATATTSGSAGLTTGTGDGETTSSDPTAETEESPDSITTSSTTADPDTTTSDSDTDAPTTGGEQSMFCPEGPFAKTPLLSKTVVATVLPGTSTSVGVDGLIEGPVWFEGSLYVSHFWFSSSPHPSEILRYVDGVGFELAQVDSGTNGLAIDHEGMLIGGNQANGTISAYDLMGGITTVVEDFEGTRFNSPNDLAVRSDGTIYFSDPNYQGPQPMPQSITAVYRVAPDGTVVQFETSLEQPNGVTLSPMEDVLYVGFPGGIRRYDLMPDGSVVTPGTEFGRGLSNIDGMTVDCAGNLYATLFSEARIAVLDPEGTELGSVEVAPSLTNAAFGGPEGRTLFITAGNPEQGDSLYSVELEIPGIPY